MSASPFQEIIDQHAEETAFLWMMHSQETHAPNPDADYLAELQQRIGTHLEGLLLSGEDGWKTCEAALEHQEAGEVFAASMVALRSGNREQLEAVLNTIDDAPNSGEGLSAALSWHPFEQVKPIADDLLGSESAVRRAAGLSTYALNKLDPGEALDKALTDEDPFLRACGCKVAATVSALRAVPKVEQLLADDDEGCAFWAAWAVSQLSNTRRLEAIRTLTESQHESAEPALRSAARAIPPEQLAAFVGELASKPETRRSAIILIGTIGDQSRIPWLIEQMRDPAQARIAGAAYWMITGIDLTRENLTKPPPERPQDDAAEDSEEMEIDSDEGLPWPDADLVAKHQNQ